MLRIAPPLAGKLDRLSRRAHAFHRFAHHPLCREYAGELIPLGRRARVCRGCLLTGLGGLSGAATGLFAAPALGLAPFALAAAVAWLVLVTLGRRAGRPIRPPKLLSRFAPAFVIVAAGVQALCAGPLGYALLFVASAALGVLMTLYRRRGPDRTPCQTCPERLGAVPCRGLAPIIRRERAFRRLAGHWISRADCGSTG